MRLRTNSKRWRQTALDQTAIFEKFLDAALRNRLTEVITLRPNPALTHLVRPIKLKQMVEHRSKNLDGVFQALADPTRRAIIALLAERPYTVTELVSPFNFSMNAISKHIKALEKAGLIDRKIRGRIHYCHLNTAPMTEAYRWLAGYEHFWTSSLDNLEKLLTKEGKVRNGKRS